MKVGALAFCMKGNNKGRIGTIQSIHKLDGSNDLVTVKDLAGN